MDNKSAEYTRGYADAMNKASALYKEELLQMRNLIDKMTGCGDIINIGASEEDFKKRLNQNSSF